MNCAACGKVLGTILFDWHVSSYYRRKIPLDEHKAAKRLRLVPIVKDKTKNISDKGNYRPIALASVMSKVFEMSLRVKLASYLHSSDYQFGFKANHSTDLCIYTLKEVIDFLQISINVNLCVFYGCV